MEQRDNCTGKRYIACGKSEGSFELYGTPGNALGAYLDGAEIILHGNAQDATGDTMNEGSITVYGSTGDAVGYAMRGGEIYIRDSAGYRGGIHMKAYKEKSPLLVIGGIAGSFLGEYQAGGTIVVLGIGAEDETVGDFCAVGMHGGKMFIRSKSKPLNLPPQINCHKADGEDMREVEKYVDEYCKRFGSSKEEIMSESFYILTPNSKNPYKRLYVYC